MRCPHCTVSIHESWVQRILWPDGQGSQWQIDSLNCPACKMEIVQLRDNARRYFSGIVFPQNVTRMISTEVQGVYRQDFQEASAVFNLSPKASAAISRRLLQLILREKGGFQQKDLSQQIEAAIASGRLPSHLADAIDGVRNIGNFAAHPLKSQISGEIVDVEPGEAEWLLDTLEGMLDFYIVQPAILKTKRDALNAKLQEIGKPPMK